MPRQKKPENEFRVAFTPRHQATPTLMKTKTTLLALSLILGVLGISGELKAQFFPTEVGEYATHQNPYYYVGKMYGGFSSVGNIVGSGTVIKRYTVLTAAHCLYIKPDGWASSVDFERAKYYGSAENSTYASRLSILGGYSNNSGSNGRNNAKGFSYDAGCFLCVDMPANGGYAGWWANSYGLTSTIPKMSLGYGAHYHDGEQMLRSAPTRTYRQSYGSFYTNTSYRIEGGMSGGPTFVRYKGNWYVCAINVAGSDTMAGVRCLSKTTTSMLKQYY